MYQLTFVVPAVKRLYIVNTPDSRCACFLALSLADAGCVCRLWRKGQLLRSFRRG